jgi:hypothetical protein
MRILREAIGDVFVTGGACLRSGIRPGRRRRRGGRRRRRRLLGDTASGQ